MLCDEMGAVAIQYNEKRKSIAGFGPILHHQILVVFFVHVNQYNQVVSSQLLPDRFISLEKCVQLPAPPAPVCSKLQKNTLVFSLGNDHSISNLLVAIGGLIVDVRWTCFGSVVCPKRRCRANEREQNTEQRDWTYPRFHNSLTHLSMPMLHRVGAAG